MKKNRIRRTVLIIVGIAVLFAVVYFVNLMTGYPFSQFIAQHSVEKHMEEHYADTDFQAEKPRRVLKLGGFWSIVTSPSHPEISFSLHLSSDGKMLEDNYQSWAHRISSVYASRCSDILLNTQPTETFRLFSFSGTFQDALDQNRAISALPGTLPDPLDADSLSIDEPYDLAELGARHGRVELDVISDEVTPEIAAQALLEVREMFEAENLPFRCVHLWLRDTKSNAYEDTIELYNFAWDDIYEEGLCERVQDAIDDAKDYNRRNP